MLARRCAKYNGTFNRTPRLGVRHPELATEVPDEARQLVEGHMLEKVIETHPCCLRKNSPQSEE